ncbi:hypothetical protein, partial [Photorhabdus sp. RM96S]|uniref:hypothetical protein n=1 Tax=Photorhabdus sp. RM96S TaxID=3342822 RepID=UPI0036DD0131
FFKAERGGIMTALPCRDVLCLHFTQFCGCEKFLEVPIVCYASGDSRPFRHDPSEIHRVYN